MNALVLSMKGTHMDLPTLMWRSILFISVNNPPQLYRYKLQHCNGDSVYIYWVFYYKYITIIYVSLNITPYIFIYVCILPFAYLILNIIIIVCIFQYDWNDFHSLNSINIFKKTISIHRVSKVRKVYMSFIINANKIKTLQSNILI